MKELPHPENFKLQAAIGWLELGNIPEAQAELDQIKPVNAQHENVLAVRWQIFAEQKDWQNALKVADQSLRINAINIEAWIHKAYAARRADSGGIKMAEEVLLEAEVLFPTEPLIQFNLACYACQTQRFDVAKSRLAKAAQLGHPKMIKDMAMRDSDLEGLKDFITKM